MKEGEGGKYAQLVSYVFIRRVIGWLGVTMPTVLFLNSKFYCHQELERSISHYYYTNLGSIFVGILTAIAMFFFAYKGYAKEKDNLLTNIAGVGALGIAFFPTDGKSGLCFQCSSSIGDGFLYIAHFTSTVTFVVSLAILTLFYFTKSHPGRMTIEKKIRNWVYRISGIGMLISLFLITYMILTEDKPFIFWPESATLFLFGIAWLVKGEMILKDKHSTQVMSTS